MVTNLNTAPHWDGIYGNWRDEGTIPLRREEMREANAAIVALCPEEGMLVDIGCGLGLLLEELAIHRPNLLLYGVDFSPLAVVLSRAAAPRATVDTFDVREGLPWHTDTFDVAFCGHIVEHLADPVALLREMVRVTKPGGRVIINFPHGDKPYEMHVHDALTCVDVVGWLARAGIEAVTELPVIPGPPTDQAIIYGLVP